MRFAIQIDKVPGIVRELNIWEHRLGCSNQLMSLIGEYLLNVRTSTLRCFKDRLRVFVVGNANKFRKTDMVSPSD